MKFTLGMILEARERLKGVAQRTGLVQFKALLIEPRGARYSAKENQSGWNHGLDFLSLVPQQNARDGRFSDRP